MKSGRTRADAIRAGVLRHIVGANRVDTARAAKTAAKAEPAKEAAQATVRPRMRISQEAIAAAGRGSKARTAYTLTNNPLTPYEPPPGVLPKSVKLAMDDAFGGGAEAFGQLSNWAFGNGIGNLFEEGIGFLGYSYLAQLTQRAEYRRISERLATEMTREWIELQVTSQTDAPVAEKPKPQPGQEQDNDDDDGEAEKADAEKVVADDKTEKLKQLDDELQRLKVKDTFYNVAEQDGWFGRAHIYVDLGSTGDEKEDQTSIGNGRNATTKAKVRRKKLQAIRNVEAMWCYPGVYGSKDPRKADFYNPSMWYVNGAPVHATRLLTFVGRELPDILKPAYAFGGLSMSQMAKPYVDNWLRTRQAVAQLIESFSVSGIYTNLQSTIQEGGNEANERLALFTLMKSNSGAMVLDKDSEEYFNISTPLGTLDMLQAQSQEQMSSVSGIPLVILLGITPQGLNASSEGEIRAFYDWIHAYQESLFRDHLQTIIEFAMINIWGKIDSDIGFVFKPLWSMTEKEEAEIDKLESEADQVRIDSGVLSPGEVRKAIAAAPGSRYADINVDELPTPPENQDGDDDGSGGDDDRDTEDDSSSDDPFSGASDEGTQPGLTGSPNSGIPVVVGTKKTAKRQRRVIHEN